MAKEITLSVTIMVRNPPYADQFMPGALSIDQSAIGDGGYTQLINHSAETVLNFGDVVTLGYCVLQNLDAAHYLVYGPESSGAMVAIGKLKAGEIAVLRLAPGIVVRARADTASVKLKVKVYED